MASTKPPQQLRQNLRTFSWPAFNRIRPYRSPSLFFPRKSREQIAKLHKINFFFPVQSTVHGRVVSISRAPQQQHHITQQHNSCNVRSKKKWINLSLYFFNQRKIFDSDKRRAPKLRSKQQQRRAADKATADFDVFCCRVRTIANKWKRKKIGFGVNETEKN